LFTIPAHRDDRLVTGGRAFMPIEMLTYAALAGRLNCSPEAARAVARRHRLPRHRSNDGNLVAVDLTEIEQTPSTRTPTRLDSKATILQLEISRLEALASSHRNDFEHQRDRNDRIMPELLKLTADLMASKEMAARLNGELSAIRARPWWRRMAG
jgi:hypothetical protein